MTAVMAPGPPVASPFKFLDYFTRDDAGRFEGRADAIEQVTVGIVQNRTFVLYGSSGSGKTSLLLAGVIPELERRHHRPVYIRTLTDPEGDLRAALLEAAGSTGSDGSIGPLARELSADEPLVLIFDQFEEFFIRFRGEPDRQQRFVEAVAGLVAEPKYGIRAVFSIRQEWLGDLDEFRMALPSLFSAEYRLQLLTPFGARQAIARQLEIAGIDYEPRLLVRLVDWLEEYKFDPTILQLVCSELYRLAAARDPDEIRFTVEDLGKLGSVPEIFRGYLAKFADGLPESSRLPARAVLDALTTEQGTKRAVTVELIGHSGFRVSEAEMAEILAALHRARLVRRETRPVSRTADGSAAGADTVVWYELVHERLVSVIEEWLRADKEYRDFRAARDLLSSLVRVDTWRGNPALFPSREAIDQTIGPFRCFLSLTPLEEEFIVRAAIYRRSADLRDWIGHGTLGPELLAASLEDPAPKMRSAAARAVAALRRDELATTITGLALNDPDQEVREAAGDALAVVGKDEHRASLVAGLSRPDRRPAAREALVRIAQTGVRAEGLGILWRWRIGREARKRRVRAMRGALAGEARLAAFRGVWAAVVWVLLVGTPTVILVTWSEGDGWGHPTAGLASIASAIGAMLVVGVVIGAGYGALIGYSMRRMAGEGGAPGSFRISLRAGWSVFAAIILAIGIYGILNSQVVVIAVAFALAIGFGLLKLVTAWLGRLSVAAEAGQARPWPWRLAATTTVPYLVGALIGAAGYRLTGDSFWEAWTVIAGAVSFLALVTAVQIPREKVHRGAPPDRPARWLVLGASAGCLIGYLVLNGIDTIPIRRFAPTIAVADSPVDFAGTIGPGVPDASYRRLVTSRLAVARINTDARITLDGLTTYLGPYHSAEHHVLLPTGAHWLGVRPFGRDDFRVTLEPAATGANVAMPTWRFTTVTLSRNPNGTDSAAGHRGSIGGTVAQPDSFNAVEVRLFDDNPVPRGWRLRVGTMHFIVSSERGDSAVIRSQRVRFEPTALIREIEPSYAEVDKLTIPTGASGRWSVDLQLVPLIEEGPLMVRADTTLDQSTERPDLTVDQPIEMAIGYRVATIDPHEYVERLIDQAEGRAANAEGQPGSQREVAALLAVAARVATQLDDEGRSSARICRFGVLNGLAREVAGPCRDAAVRSHDNDVTWIYYAVALAFEGDFPAAVQALGRYAPPPARMLPDDGSIRRLVILSRRAVPRIPASTLSRWLRELRSGRNPFADPAELAPLRLMTPTKILSAAVEGG